MQDVLGGEYRQDNSITAQAEDSSNYKFGFTREQFICSLDLPEDQEIIKIADGLINGTLYVHSNIEATTYDIDNLDWNIQFSDSPNTFQLYLQCLNPVLYLTRAYELCANEQYMNMADALIKSWNKYLNNSELSSNNPFLWYDHGTALRAENLIYYSLVASEAHILNKNTARLIIDLLNSHADFLSNNQNYTENH